MSDTIRNLIENISRRSVLGKLAAATSGAVLALVGSSKPAEAQSHCCTGMCTWISDICPDVICSWTWSCCNGSGVRWLCSEQYTSIQYDCRGCQAVSCSMATQSGTC